MGKKQDQAASAKMTKDAGKGMELGRARKPQHSKPRGTENLRRSAPKSKLGFTLYSEPSDAMKQMKPKIQRSSISTNKQPQIEKEAEEHFLQQTDVVSQMQMQTELVKDDEVAGIVIPAADCESDGDNTLYGNFDHQEFGTPFNKRLVSSTPDPERLLEAELLENIVSQPSVMYPQMIPERDTTQPIKSSALLTTVASSLCEKLKMQRQKVEENQQFLQKQQQLESQWQQREQQFQYPISSLKHLVSPLKQNHFQLHEPNNQLPTVTTSHVPITKAEWLVSGSSEHEDIRQDKTKSTLAHSAKTSNAVSDNVKKKVFPNMAHPEIPVCSEDTMHYFHPPAQVQSSSKTPFQSQMIDHAHNKQSYVTHSSFKFEKGSEISNNSYSTNYRADILAKGVESHQIPGSAFSKPEMSTVTNMIVVPPNLHSSTGETFPELSDINSENTLTRPEFTERSCRKKSPIRTVTHMPSGQDDSKSFALRKKIKRNNTKFNEEYKEPNIENAALIPPKVYLSETDRKVNEEISQNNKILQSNDHLMQIDLDISGDTCDNEVINVLYEYKNDNNVGNIEAHSTPHKSDTCVDTKEEHAKLNGKNDNMREEDTFRKSPASDAANLSQVIAFLKNDAFNKAQECGGEDMKFNNESDVVRDIDIGIKTSHSKTDKIESDDNDTLSALMRQYLPETEESIMNKNVSNCAVNDISTKPEEADESYVKESVDVNVNQNHFNDHDYEMQSRPKNLRYLERMADPILRDIACRLTLKATALRDVELRDLIDDMIFHTDAALGDEEARLQSSQMFFTQENNKLKKRIQNINQQLDTKERQERLGINKVLSDNEVLHLEKKIMLVSQDKEKLDNQVTTLLEEKAKWLITQQDLVRTISLKDREIMKLEEKHHEEKKLLLQSLDQATKNSTGVHYKLSVADREICNLEQNIRSRNVEIMHLKEQLKETEGKLMECERYSKLKDQEMLRLQDLVDALKIGVDHVLQAYESSSSNEATTVNQRRGIENLCQMVHPEKFKLYRSILSDPGETPQTDHRTVPVQVPQILSTLHRTTQNKEMFLRPEGHYSQRSRPHQKHYSIEVTNFKTPNEIEHSSRKDYELDKLPKRLTFKTLEEHNRCLTPVDRTLWRSLDHEPRISRISGEDPYYSDSEIEVNGHRRRRFSHIYHRNDVDNLQSRVPHFSLSQRPDAERTEQFSGTHDEIRNSQSTKYSTLRSETIPKSVETQEPSSKDPFSEDTYYSSLRSETLHEQEPVPYKNHKPSVHYNSEIVIQESELRPKDPLINEYIKGSSHIHERDPVQRTLIHETHHPQSLSVSHPPERHRHKNSMNQRNAHQLSLGHEHAYATGSSITTHPRNLMDKEAHFDTVQPEYLSFDPHRVSHHRFGSFQHTDVESEPCRNFDQYSHPQIEHPINSTTHPGQERHRSQNRVDRGRLMSPASPPHPDYSYPGRNSQEPYFHNDTDQPSYCEQSSLFNARSSGSYPASIPDISVSRRATRDSNNITQREFFHGTELSASLSSISETDIQSTNNNQLKNLNEDPFSSGIASLDEKIASLQRKIDRTKAMFS